MNNKRIKMNEHKHLAALVYEMAVRKEIEEKVKSKYLKRIDYLVAANNELMYELEQCELEKVGNVSIPYSVADRILLEENINEN